MAYVQTRTVGTGELISGAFAVVGAARREIGIYLAVFAALGLLLAIEFVGGLVSVASFVLYFPAQYWLCQKMIKRSGMGHNGQFRVFGLFAMAILLGLGISIGFNLFWIPGIIFGAKWVMAPSFLAAEEGNFIDAIGASWRASDGNTLALSLAYTAIGAIGLAVFWVTVAMAGMSDRLFTGDGVASGPVGGIFLSLSLNILPIAMMALSVAAYRLLSDDTESLAAVFE